MRRGFLEILVHCGIVLRPDKTLSMRKDILEKKKKRAKILLQELKKLFPVAETILYSTNDLEFLIAVRLSAQTTDIQVNKVTKHLFVKYKTLDDYCTADPLKFEQDIASIGLYKTKAKHILALVKILKEKYQGRIPDTLEELIALPGIGRKTANVVLGFVHGKVSGIAVDTHVTRLAKKWGLTDSADPKKIEQELMQILPKEEWHDFTLRVIDYGRKYSPARKDDMPTDPLSLKLLDLDKKRQKG